MQRNIKDFASFNALRHIIYVPIVVCRIKNWFSFLLNYLGLRNSSAVYELRNGIRVSAKDAFDAVTIAVVFVKKAYGDVPDGSVIIDIGAHIGVYALYAALTSKNSRVYAYEPMSENYNILLENIALNDCDKRIFPFPSAIGARNETRRLYVGSGSPFHTFYRQTAGQKSVLVQCITLKDIFDMQKIERCDVLKLDCEGAEYEILYELPQEYFEKIRQIRMEYHNLKAYNNWNGEALIKFLQRHGYRLLKHKRHATYGGDIWVQKT